MTMLHKAMTIAGSDASGGAGMEADLKTFQELGVYGMTALTVIVAQNPHKDWDHEIFPIGLDVVEKQIETIVAGIGHRRHENRYAGQRRAGRACSPHYRPFSAA